MIRKRNSAFLVLALVFVALLYLNISQEKPEHGTQYPQLLGDVQLGRSLRAVPSLPLATVPVDRNCSRGTLMYGSYCVLSPYENEIRDSSNASIVTLCTQGTVEFLHHVIILCYRWSAPISVAVYSPRDDYADARIKVDQLRQCSYCVRHWVSWHFFYPEQEELPPVDRLSDIKDCDSTTMRTRSNKRRSQGVYPINVGRNVARRLSNTPFVFSSDIELYPSLDIPAKFERMIRSQVLSPERRQVFVLPVFEVRADVQAPLFKSELRKLYAKQRAISFHKYRCDRCHKIPNLTQWIAHGERWHVSELKEFVEPMKIWTSVKRNRHNKLQEWEPFFIGTNEDPEFDIRLSWEGKQNKMQMAYEMCMLNYDYHIVENAFLIHAPGINVYSAAKEKYRAKYATRNNDVIKKVKRSLIKKYGSKNDCG